MCVQTFNSVMLRRSVLLLVINVLMLILTPCETLTERSSRKQKRQLFRENVLPDLGGKIPEFAYQPDRISLNVLNQNGVIFNGYILEPSRSAVRYGTKNKNPEVLRLSRIENRSIFSRGDLSSPTDVYTAYILRRPTQTVTFPVPIKYNTFPASPYSSLNLVYRYRQENKLKSIRDPCLNQVRPKDCLSESIFEEFAPYLRKLHELYR